MRLTILWYYELKKSWEYSLLSFELGTPTPSNDFVHNFPYYLVAENKIDPLKLKTRIIINKTSNITSMHNIVKNISSSPKAKNLSYALHQSIVHTYVRRCHMRAT